MQRDADDRLSFRDLLVNMKNKEDKEGPPRPTLHSAEALQNKLRCILMFQCFVILYIYITHSL